MADHAVLVTRRLPGPVEERLGAHYRATLNPEDTVYTPETLVTAAAGHEAILLTPTEQLTAGTVNALPESVRLVCSFAVGVDHIDLDAARARGLTVTNTPRAVTTPTAEIALLLILAASRGQRKADRRLREGQWSRWRPNDFLGNDLAGKTLGLVGMGRIGQATAQRARAFGLAIHYHQRRPLPDEAAGGATYHRDLEGLLGASDIVSLHCPLTEATRGLINRDAIKAMRDGAILVNTARGPIIDDDAVLAGLSSGKLAAAGLDVFTGEPNLDPRYLGMDTAVLLPHIGTATRETRTAMGMEAVDNLDAFFAGETPPARVI